MGTSGTTDIDKGVNSQIKKSDLRPGQSIEPSIDWITATSKKEEVGRYWRELHAQYAADFYPEVTHPKTFSYVGWEGPQLPGFTYAIHPKHGAMVRVTGFGAGVAWRDVLSRVEYCNVTRIDLCVTVTLQMRMTGIATNEYAALISSGYQPHIKKKLVTNSDGGETLYIGSRTSQVFVRLYDKSAERGEEPGDVWRYEIEYKKPVSQTVAEMIMSLAGGDDSEVWETINDTVWTAFDDRGVTPIFSAGDAFLAPTTAHRERSPVEAQMKWLAVSVSPAVRRLAAAGYGQAIREILGLDFDD